MEIKTCEEYVLSRVFELECENRSLKSDIERLNSIVERLNDIYNRVRDDLVCKRSYDSKSAYVGFESSIYSSYDKDRYKWYVDTFHLDEPVFDREEEENAAEK